MNDIYSKPIILDINNNFSYHNIGVIYGGWSAERDISLISGQACFDAIKKIHNHVILIDPNPHPDVFCQQLRDNHITLVFNALHGSYGEDGYIQSLCDLMKISYTHSGMRASAIAMHKPTSLELFAYHHIDTPKGYVIKNLSQYHENDLPIQRPMVVKPVSQGSSLGTYIILEDDIFPDFKDWNFGDALCEEYIAGRELTVAVLGNIPLGVTELNPNTSFYDYHAKYNNGITEHIFPANIDDDIYEEAMQISLNAHQIIGCRGATRCDFRYDEKNHRLCLLEINTQPGMTPLSLVPEQAIKRGISFETLITWMLSQATHD